MATDSTVFQGQDRRRNMKLRAIYPDARIRIDHFFHAHTEWAGSPKDYLALRVIHEAYPILSSDEVRTLVNAIELKVQQEIAERKD